MAEEAKDRGNAAFKAREYEAAVHHYSDGIDLSPDNYVLYSNRSAAYAALNLNLLALKDAVKIYELRPDWPRTYVRLGNAHLGLGRLDQAICSFKLGLEIGPDDGLLKSGYEKAMSQAKKRVQPLKAHVFGDIFTAPSVWEKLKSDPDTVKFVHQRDFQRMMRELQQDPFNANKHSSDPRLLQALGVVLNVKFRVAKEPAPESGFMKVDKQRQQHTVEEEPEDEIEAKTNLEATIGNYITEIDLEDNINELEKEKQLSAFDRAGAILRMPKIDYSKLPLRRSALKSESVMNRKRSNLEELLYKQDGSSSIATLKNKFGEVEYSEFMMQSAEQAEEIANFMLQILDAEADVVELRNEMKTLEEQRLYEVLRDHYTERLKCYPEDPELYGNRSACYMGLGAFHEGLKDADKCIELDPCLWKGYHRRGQVLFHMREFDKAVETYMLGLKRSQNNENLLNAFGKCMYQLN